jgi:hypothetical protein
MGPVLPLLLECLSLFFLVQLIQNPILRYVRLTATEKMNYQLPATIRAKWERTTPRKAFATIVTSACDPLVTSSTALL